DTDEGRADRCLDDPVPGGIEADISADVRTLSRGTSGLYCLTRIHAVRGESVIEPDHKVSLEIRQPYVAEVRVHAVGVIADDLARSGIDAHEPLDAGASCLDHDACLRVRGKRESQEPTVVGSGNLRTNLPRRSRIHEH